MEKVFYSSSMGKLIIKKIDKGKAKELIIKNHYSHKWQNGFGIINIGIFKDNCDKCLGVAVFGNMMNSNSYNNFGLNNKNEILELNRMWIDDCLGKNAESILISNSFKIIKKEMPYVKLIQSFADGRLGCGTIYKATNFHYYGYKINEFYEDLVTGEISMVGLLRRTDNMKKMIKDHKKILDNQILFFKTKSYRYIYPLRKGALKGVKFKELEYPKYYKGIEYYERDIKYWEFIRCYIGCFIYDYDKKTIEDFKLVLKKSNVEVNEIIEVLKTNKTILKLIDKKEKNIEDLEIKIRFDYKINN